MSEQLPIPKFEYTPEQEAEFAAKQAAYEAGQHQDELLSGPRRTGDIPMAAGGFERHAVTTDGMKYTQYHGEKYKTAAEFHRAAGVAQPYEMEKADSKGSESTHQEPRRRRAGQMLGRVLRRRG